MQNIIDGVRKWALKRDRYEKTTTTILYMDPFNKSLAAKQMKSNEKKTDERNVQIKKLLFDLLMCANRLVNAHTQ